MDWFRDKEAAIFADFLERWPTLDAAQRARRETLESFFRAGNVRQASSIEKRIKAIGVERSLHSDEAVTGPARLLVEALLPQLRVLTAGIGRFEAEIARLTPRQPDYKLFGDLPGAGPTFAPRLLVAFGERRQAALRALAFNWIRILHRCWVDRVPYDESRYLMALQKRGAPLLKHAAQNPA